MGRLYAFDDNGASKGARLCTANDIAEAGLHSVYLSGNGPLVAILTEALARDRIAQERRHGRHLRKGVARQAVKAFIQAVHHFRDEGVKDPSPPPEHVTIFDEAQRAWNLAKTADFMQRKKGQKGFRQSEPDFLISCLDRHRDWAVIVCLVGGGQPSCVAGFLHPGRDVALAVQHALHLNVVGVLDVEDQVGIPCERPGAKARQVLAHELAAGAEAALANLFIHEGFQGRR